MQATVSPLCPVPPVGMESRATEKQKIMTVTMSMSLTFTVELRLTYAGDSGTTVPSAASCEGSQGDQGSDDIVRCSVHTPEGRVRGL